MNARSFRRFVFLSTSFLFFVAALPSGASEEAADEAADLIRRAEQLQWGDEENGVAKDYRQALSLFREAAGKGSLRARRMLGEALVMRADGDGTPTDEERREALRLLRDAAEGGDPVACNNLGVFLRFQVFGPIADPEEAIEWLRRGARLGSGSCMMQLSEIYRDGELGLQNDEGKALDWLFRAATCESPSSEALFAFGTYVLRGGDTSRFEGEWTDGKAIAMILRAADEGSTPAVEWVAGVAAGDQPSPGADEPYRPETTEVELTNGVSIALSKVPGGAWFGRTEVTRAQWAAVMGEPCEEDPDLPASGMSWDECIAFLDRLNALDAVRARRLVFRLPTSEEWEWACRAGGRGLYGLLADGTEPAIDRVAWYRDNSGDEPALHPVGLKEPNAYGLFDMHGNVFEWVADANRNTGMAPIRGGAYLFGPDVCRAANQGGVYCELGLGTMLGLRVCAFDRGAPGADLVLSPMIPPPAAGFPAEAGALRCAPLPGGGELRMHWCPAGAFWMGSGEAEAGRWDDERNHHVVLTRGFWVGETEVTQGQWESVMDGTTVVQLVRAAVEDETEYDFGSGMQTYRQHWKVGDDFNPKDWCANMDSETPVYYVSFNDARTFCERLTQREREAGRLPPGYVYRLPTEAEWECACRAGEDGTLPNGAEWELLGANNAPALDSIAWYAGNSNDGYEGRGWDNSNYTERQMPGGIAGPRRVRGKAANALGLYDMLGNLAEWCLDAFVPFDDAPVVDPFQAVLPSGETPSARILRGGGWDSTARVVRPAARMSQIAGRRERATGFRVFLAPELP